MSYFDETLKDWIRTQQAASGMSRELLSLLNSRNNRILELLGPGVNKKNLSHILSRIRSLDYKTRRKVFDLIEKQLSEVATITYRNEAGNIEFLDIDVNLKKTFNPSRVVNKSMDVPMRGADRTVRELMKDVFGNSNTAASNIIARSVSEGMTGYQTRRVLKERFGVDSRHLSTVVATAMNATANGARTQFYADNKDVIPRVMWRSTLDSKTSSQCQSLDGQIWEVDEPHPTPPAHPNCRSFLVPVVDGMTDKEARSMMRPAVVDGEAHRTKAPNYGEWLQKQSAAFQKQVLGEERYKMLKDNKVSFDKFFTKDGRRLTIDELNNKY